MTKEQAKCAVEKFIANAKRFQAEHYASHNGENHFIKLIHIIDDEFIHLLFSHWHNDYNIKEDTERAIVKSYEGLTQEEQSLVKIIRAMQEKYVDYENIYLSSIKVHSSELFESNPAIYENI